MSKSKRIVKSAKEKMELVRNPGGALAAQALFRDNKTGVTKGLKVRSRSPLLKPAVFPVGRILSGIFKRTIVCIAGKGEKGRDKLGCLIEIVPDLNSVGVAIPATATLVGPLEITQEGDGTKEGTKFLSPYIGHMVEIEKLDDKIPSKKGQDAWNFLVAISDEKATV
jgi:hypothetical protein